MREGHGWHSHVCARMDYLETALSPGLRLAVMLWADWKFQKSVERASDLDSRTFGGNEAMTSNKARVRA